MNKILRTKSIMAISVAVVTFIVFLPSLRNEFVNWDDKDYVYANPFIRSFDTKLLKSAFGGFHASNWHPLTWLSHAFDYAIWDLDPLGHHLTNNILHTLNTLMVVFLVMRLMAVFKKTEKGKGLSQSSINDRTIMITGAATGLLFGLHPLHVESVAWVAERKDLLCAFFFLLTIITYTRYVSELRTSVSINSASFFFNKKYLVAIGFFILALLSKPMAVTLPFVLLILDWYLFRRMQSLKTFWIASAEKIPFLVFALVSSALTILAQQAGGSIKSVADIPLASRVIVAAKSLIAYLSKMMVPLDLVPFYPYPENASLFSLDYIVPIIIVIAITAACIAVMRKQKFWMSVWSYYVITLMPVLGIVKVGDQAMADRYAYLPSLGPFLVIGFIAAKVYEKVSTLNRWRVLLRMACFFVAMIMLVSMSYATIKQIGLWKNSIVFWNYVIAGEPSRVPLAHTNLGEAYISKGQFDMATEQIRIALRLNPNDAGAYSNLGTAYLSEGLFDTAIDQYLTALRLKPDFVEAHYNLGYAYLSQGKFDMAIEQFLTVLRLNPNDAGVYNNLGNAYLSLGQLDMAIEQYKTALSLKPKFTQVHYNLGNAYLSKGLSDMAIEQYSAALRLVPNFAKAHYKLGLSYLGKGLNDMAKAEFELELSLRPDNYEARQALNSIVTK